MKCLNDNFEVIVLQLLILKKYKFKVFNIIVLHLLPEQIHQLYCLSYP